MGLSDIADGLAVTTEQEVRGVATVDETGGDRPLAARLDEYADELPCDPGDAAAVIEAYTAGRSVGDAAHEAGLAPVTAAKTLYRCGEQVTPLSPTGREIVRDWIAGDVSRSDALTLTRASEPEFALAVFVETHDPIPGVRAICEAVRASDEPSSALTETIDDAHEYL
jgi:hypothetical protein